MPARISLCSAIGVLAAAAVSTFSAKGDAATNPKAIEKEGRPASPFAPWLPSKGAFECRDVRRAALQLSVHAYNLANRATTRTPQGGPYRPRSVECRDEHCSMAIKSGSTMLVYQPGHPDANAEGYVLYPSISVAKEYAAVNAAAAELKLLAANEVCGTTALSSATSALIKYPRAIDAASDTLAFAADGRLTSWSRVGKDGRSYQLQFNADGTVSLR